MIQFKISNKTKSKKKKNHALKKNKIVDNMSSNSNNQKKKIPKYKQHKTEPQVLPKKKKGKT